MEEREVVGPSCGMRTPTRGMRRRTRVARREGKDIPSIHSRRVLRVQGDRRRTQDGRARE